MMCRTTVLTVMMQGGVVGLFLNAVLSTAHEGIPVAQDIKASYKLT